MWGILIVAINEFYIFWVLIGSKIEMELDNLLVILPLPQGTLENSFNIEFYRFIIHAHSYI